jgi:hypothetical protein
MKVFPVFLLLMLVIVVILWMHPGHVVTVAPP